MNTTTKYPPRHIPGFRPLVPGEAWHRLDWTPDMLPEGCRPLLLGEKTEAIDELPLNSSRTGDWRTLNTSYGPALERDVHFRTRRPLPPPPPTFEHDGKTWNSHVPGDPCPVDKTAKVEILLADETHGGDGTACGFHWSVTQKTLAHGLLVIGYRIPDAEPQDDTANLCASTGVGTLKATVHRLDQRLTESLSRIAELEQQLANALTPRPIAEAGEMKEGFVRLFGQLDEDCPFMAFQDDHDTHFLDIRFPSPDPRAEYERAVAEAGGAFEAWLKAKGGVK